MEDHRDAQAERERRQARIVVERRAHLGELAALREHEVREPPLLLAREAGHVGVGEDVGRVLVVRALRDRHADLVQPRGPVEEASTPRARIASSREPAQERAARGRARAAPAPRRRGSGARTARPSPRGCRGGARGPSRSQSTPSRSAPSATVISSRPSSSKTADMIATPPAITGMRSSRSPASASLRKSPAASELLAQPLEARGGDAARRDGRSCCRTSAIERAVPEEPTASSQPSLLEARGDASAPARARRARPCFIAFLSMLARRERSARCSSRSPCRGSPSRLRLHLVADDELGRAAADVDHEPVVARPAAASAPRRGR